MSRAALGRFVSTVPRLMPSPVPRGAPWRTLGRLLMLVFLPFLAPREGSLPALAAPAPSPSAQAPRSYEADPVAADDAPSMDRYLLRVRPGASLWDIATEALPKLTGDEGPVRVVELVETAYKKAYPDRNASIVRAGDTFALDVPAGTFVTASATSADRGRTIDYTAFNGDRLTEYTADPAVVYRLVRAHDPGHALVLVRQGTNVPAVELAKRVYQTDAPDYLQVRYLRGGLGDNPIVDVDLRRPYLDNFRNYRDRAISVEPTEDGLQLYRFDPADAEVPFVAVEDGIGDEWDPANFPPRVARNEVYRDGTVKRFLLTQPGDVLALLARPDNKRWTALAPDWPSWNEGQPERLGSFAPAVNDAGSLIPGRLLVLVHRPKPADAVSRGMQCFGVPLGLAAGAGLLNEWWRRRRRHN